MSRPKRIRKVNNPPHFKGFKPIGILNENQPVILNFEEYESIRLSDFELLGQVEASKIMDVSRPTFARIYESARRKVAQAFVSGSPIVFEGGKVYFNSDWYSCHRCGCWFNHPQKDQAVTGCALCGSSNIGQYHEYAEDLNGKDVFVCLQCGKKRKDAPASCLEILCPDCNKPMIRKGILI
ncbi:MAG: DUF134 domain-containing protein [Mangrovibacterium sp.]|nr:DUF134 domain-containing protein [Mangrovibacterium sp.]